MLLCVEADRIRIFRMRKLRFREVKRFERLVANGGAVSKMKHKAIHPFSLIPLLIQLLWSRALRTRKAADGENRC